MKDYIKYPYPLTIICDRYSGTYSGGRFTAWNYYPKDIPEGQDGGDCECMEFWGDFDNSVGKGDTADEAIKDLMKKLE